MVRFAVSPRHAGSGPPGNFSFGLQLSALQLHRCVRAVVSFALAVHFQFCVLAVNGLAVSALTCSSRRCSFSPGFQRSVSQPRRFVLAVTGLAVSDLACSGHPSSVTFANWQCSFVASASACSGQVCCFTLAYWYGSAWQLQLGLAVVCFEASSLRTGSDQFYCFSSGFLWSA